MLCEYARLSEAGVGLSMKSHRSTPCSFFVIHRTTPEYVRMKCGFQLNVLPGQYTEKSFLLHKTTSPARMSSGAVWSEER
jgi:hypothetical protein